MAADTSAASEQVTHERAQANLERLYGILNEHDPAKIPLIFTEEVVFEDDAWPETVRGHLEMRRFLTTVWRALLTSDSRWSRVLTWPRTGAASRRGCDLAGRCGELSTPWLRADRWSCVDRLRRLLRVRRRPSQPRPHHRQHERGRDPARRGSRPRHLRRAPRGGRSENPRPPHATASLSAGLVARGHPCEPHPIRSGAKQSFVRSQRA